MLKKKINNKKGFTLAETLVAILIMLMVSSIMVTGIPAAKNAYEKVFTKANAEVLLSTCIYSLRTEMAGARNINVTGNKVVYLNAKYGSRSEIYIHDGNIMYKRYSYISDASPAEGLTQDEAVEEPLVSDAAEDNMKVRYSGVEKKEGYITYKDLCVYAKDNDNNDENDRALLESRNLSITTF